MVSRESLMYHSKLDSGVPSSLCWTQCLYCHRVSGLLARPGASHAANGDCSDRCALEVAFYQLLASDHRTLGSAAGVGSQDETMTMISDTGAPTDVSVPYSCWSGKSSHSWYSSLGPVAAGLREEATEASISVSWDLTLGWGPGKGNFRGL